MGEGAAQVVIADDHEIVRHALRTILLTIKGVRVVGEAEHGFDAIALTKTLRPDLLVLDSAMPLANGSEVYGEVRRWSPGTKVVLVTGFTAAGQLADWVAAGVDGLVLKTEPAEGMRAAFAAVLRGERFLASNVRRLVEHYDAVSPIAAVTPRERQVLHLVADGLTNAEIARRLSISAKTVDNHRTRLMAKLGVSSSAQLVALALREGLLDRAAQR